MYVKSLIYLLASTILITGLSIATLNMLHNKEVNDQYEQLSFHLYIASTLYSTHAASEELANDLEKTKSLTKTQSLRSNINVHIKNLTDEFSKTRHLQNLYEQEKFNASIVDISETIIGLETIANKIPFNEASIKALASANNELESKLIRLQALNLTEEEKVRNSIIAGSKNHLKQLILSTSLFLALGIIITLIVVNRVSNILAKLTDSQEQLKKSQAEILAREQRISTLVANIIDGIVTVDENDNIESANPAMEHMFDYQAGELNSKTLSSLFQGFNASDEGITQTLGKENNNANFFSVIGIRKDGSEFPIDLSISEMNVNGRRLFNAVLRDVTERKEAELLLSERNILLERANKMKAEFLANMSHELRTPLNAIIGFSEILKDKVGGELNETQEDYTNEIFNSANHLLSLINDILEFSRIEAGEMKLELEEIELHSFLNTCIALIKKPAHKKNIKVELNIQEGMISLVADASKLKQIIYNLLSNAVKFTPEGGAITVEASHNKSDFRLDVIDTGIGISEDNADVLFSPFQQVDGSLSRQHEGTGLGLALVKRLVEIHGGHVSFTSVVGEGSCFTFTIPYRSSV